MVVLGYIFHLICAIVPCEGKYENAEIATTRVGRQLEEGFGNGTREEYPVVWTDKGRVQGYTQLTTEGRKIWAFESIQYGEAPVGNLRFKSPVPVKPWSGIRRAMKSSPHCLQTHALHLFRLIGQEDCLYLNIYSPKLPSNSSQVKLPVLVMIHGGSFSFGSASEFGPAYLLNNDIVYVSINYRLGPLGFLSTGDDACPGNSGLKDQALALKFIVDNIENFGGDKTNITLFGNSAGGVSAHHQYLYNKDIRNNLKGVFTLSGNSFVQWGVRPRLYARKLADRLARLVRCPVEDSEAMMNCLRRKNPARLVAQQLNLFDIIPFPPILFVPTVEKESPDAFITEIPEKVYEKRDVPKITWISSVSSKEGYLALHIWKLMLQYKNFKRHFDDFAPKVFNYRYLVDGQPELNLTEITEKVKDFYFQGLSPVDATKDMISDIFTDRYFTASWAKAMTLHSQIAPAYAYVISYNTSYTTAKNFNLPPEFYGPEHGQDTMYYCNMTSYVAGFKLSDPEYKLSQILINLLTNFLYTGKPTYTDRNSGNQMQIWDPITANNNMRVLSIDKDIKMVPYPFKQRQKFWESLGLDDTTPLKTDNPLTEKEQSLEANDNLSNNDVNDNFITV